uniref:Uncharacterized protein n=1 Tax=Arundo donax TaxID=35708 RepID=A0A0A9EPH7_ARUDO
MLHVHPCDHVYLPPKSVLMLCLVFFDVNMLLLAPSLIFSQLRSLCVVI